MAKYLIHTYPKRIWYVNGYLIPSMIKQGINGFIFQSEDVQELEIALKKALALKCFDQSIQTAKNYTIERMAERTIDMIRAILS